jgi:DNA-binding beta-propeller fold protein YncE
MMVTVAPPPLKYSHTIGLLALTGRGFSNPMNTAVTDAGILYVANRSNSFQALQGAVRITVCNIEGEYLSEFGSYGTEDGSFVWPTGIDVDSKGNVYLADEHRNDVQVWDKDHNFARKWGGGPGDGDAEMNRPAGLAVDSHDDVVVSDGLNNRILKFSPEGKLLAKWGSAGTGEGQFNMPWGVGVDGGDNVYVADWRNDRVQKFSPDGKYLASFGSSGSDTGQLKRPADVAVDSDGNVYVADWGNERVSVFEADGYPLTTLLGDADLSRWGGEYISANEDIIRGRQIAADMSLEKRFWGPTGVAVDQAGHVLIVESCRHRVQVYDRVQYDDF